MHYSFTFLEMDHKLEMKTFENDLSTLKLSNQTSVGDNKLSKPVDELNHIKPPSRKNSDGFKIMSSLRKGKSDLPVYSTEEVSKHNTENDCWIILNGKVYDITNFFSKHPGGKRALLNFAGKDASSNIQFHSPLMMKQAKSFYIGELEGYRDSGCVIS